MVRTTAPLTALLLALTACGSGDAVPAAAEPAADATTDDEPDAGDDATSGDPTPTSQDAESEPVAEPAADTDLAGNTAVVTIGDRTFEFDVTPGAIQRCDPDFFNSFWALGGNPDGSGINMNLIPEDDPNFDEVSSIEVRDGTSASKWLADPNTPQFGVDPGMSQVDTWSVEGGHATGTATFIDLEESYKFQGGTGDAPVPVAGTFEVLCSAE